MTQGNTNYSAILRGEVPILDVRAPIEFGRGAPSEATNLPILDDAERRQVGICYKESGQQAAIELGHQLVNGSVKECRIEQWKKYIRSNPNALVMCWRGGLRSELAQNWLAEAGLVVGRVKGGYKAVRQHCITLLEQPPQTDFLVIAGQTGVGKTGFINGFQQAIDLEGIANHRGSSFGRLATPQPNPIQFEFNLIKELLLKQDYSLLLVEDESRMIGKLAIPQVMFESMQTSPVCILESGIEDRVELTFDLYVQGVKEDLLLPALDRIKKRLGGALYQSLSKLMQTAFRENSIEMHKHWIHTLLENYYDPMYEHQLSKKLDRVIFKGPRADLEDFLKTHYSIS